MGAFRAFLASDQCAPMLAETDSERHPTLLDPGQTSWSAALV